MTVTPTPADLAAPERITVARRIGTGRRDIICAEINVSMGYVEPTEYIRADLADLAAPVDPAAPITMTYRNYRGEVADRTVTPKRIWWGSTDWHPELGWLMTAFDHEKQADRDFALADADFRRAHPAAPAEVEGLVRWKHLSHPNAHKIVSHPDGEWVSYDEAATALTALQADNERLRGEVAKDKADWGDYCSTIARAEKAEAERDEAQLMLCDAYGAQVESSELFQQRLAHAKLKGEV